MVLIASLAFKRLEPSRYYDHRIPPTQAAPSPAPAHYPRPPPSHPLAPLLDLAWTKASVVQLRAEAKDNVDIDALLQDKRNDLLTALISARNFYRSTARLQVSLIALLDLLERTPRSLPTTLCAGT